MATRNKDFASVYRKVMTMKKRVEEKIEKDYKGRSKKDGNWIYMEQHRSLFEVYDRLREENLDMSTVSVERTEELLEKYEDLRQKLEEEVFKVIYRYREE